MTLPTTHAGDRLPATQTSGVRASGITLLVLGLIGHLYAAHAIGGSRVAYTHHVLGFVLILVVTGAVLAALGWRVWRCRPDLTLLAIGVVQALFGLMVALDPARVAGAHGG